MARTQMALCREIAELEKGNKKQSEEDGAM